MDKLAGRRGRDHWDICAADWHSCRRLRFWRCGLLGLCGFFFGRTPRVRLWRGFRLLGCGVAVGRRFHRSGDHIERVLTLAALPDRRAPEHGTGLRPLERRLLRWRDAGLSAEELADRFRRGPRYVERVLALADYKQTTS